MTRIRWKMVLVVLGFIILTYAGLRLYHHLYTPKAWTALQQWGRTAKPGELLKGNAELAMLDGRDLPPVHTQKDSIKFLFSDSPEYLYNDSVSKGLACMRLTDDAAYRDKPEASMPFGAGIYHINKVTDPDTLKSRSISVSLVVRLMKSVTDGGKTYRNTRPAVVHLLKGAWGTSDVMPMYAGKACAMCWFTEPNIQPATILLQPGEATDIFMQVLPPNVCINAMFDLNATNAYFLRVYVVCGTVRDYDHLAYAPYGNTIGTNSGTGYYWKRILRPVGGTPPFDASNPRHLNKIYLRFVKMPPDVQYLDDETWDLRPENAGKKLIRSKGGRRRPFKGDYNVEYTIIIPVVSCCGKPANFALVDVQRFGMFGGAAKVADQMVPIPVGSSTCIHTGAEGVLLDRATVSSKTPENYQFHWFLPGGSYGDQAFMLVPLGETEK